MGYLRARLPDIGARTVGTLVLAIAVTLTVAACNGDDGAAPVDPPTALSEPAPAPAPSEPPQPSPAPDDEAAALAFRFDGESCEATVPETIVAGVHEVTFDNQSGAASFMGTGGLRQEFTVEQALALARAARTFNVNDPIPEWLDPGRVQFPGLVADSESKVRGTAVFEPGTYLFSCVFPDPADPTSDTGLWITGGSFVVEDAFEPDA